MSGNSTAVFKYVLAPTDVQSVILPGGSEILSIAEQHDQIVVYAIVADNGQKKEEHEFRILGTGHPITFIRCDYRFLGTVKIHNGALMFHIFQRKLI